MTKKQLQKIAIATVIAILFVYLGISSIAAWILTKPARKEITENPALLQLKYSDVEFLSSDEKASISGWFMPANSDKILILVHGKDSNRVLEGKHNFLNLAADLNREGFNILMIDLRGHGQSSDARFSFGIKERYDVEGAVNWLLKKGFASGNIGVIGNSMGGATSIMATAEIKQIGALITDSAYADIEPLIKSQWPKVSHLPYIFLPSTLMISKLFLGYDITEAKPVQEINQITPRPMMIIHGDQDTLVPVDNAYQLKKAYPQAELWITNGVDHVASYKKNPAIYVKRVGDFFRKNLK
jgi:uncharacterized protein